MSAEERASMLTPLGVADRLRNPVVMPGVQRRVADELAEQYPELASQVAGLLEYEVGVADRMPSVELPGRTRLILNITRLLSKES